MNLKNILTAVLAVLVYMLPTFVSAADHVIKAGAREFKPATIYVAEGDKVKFSNMNSHNSVSVEGLIPEGATAWIGAMGENVAPDLSKPGIYSYVCQPHIGFGMVGVIVVGDISAEDIAAYKQNAIDTLKGPYRRLIGKINKLKPTK
ncbi:MAG: copper-binding protein [Proteobacteria bacterium]|nr:copper-binding protein [Pseudomonadota bacterium]NOG59212.1 copper-binding protein [Pseudomonadota bacterium]